MNPSKIEALAESMRSHGYDVNEPISTYEIKGNLYINNGHHRAQAAIRAGITDVPVTVQPVTNTNQVNQIISDWAQTTSEYFK
jgi:filamentous hemagglutinin